MQTQSVIFTSMKVGEVREWGGVRVCVTEVEIDPYTLKIESMTVNLEKCHGVRIRRKPRRDIDEKPKGADNVGD